MRDSPRGPGFKPHLLRGRAETCRPGPMAQPVADDFTAEWAGGRGLQGGDASRAAVRARRTRRRGRLALPGARRCLCLRPGSRHERALGAPSSTAPAGRPRAGERTPWTGSMSEQRAPLPPLPRYPAPERKPATLMVTGPSGLRAKRQPDNAEAARPSPWKSSLRDTGAGPSDPFSLRPREQALLPRRRAADGACPPATAPTATVPPPHPRHGPHLAMAPMATAPQATAPP